MTYFQRLKNHPGLELACILTLVGFLAGATNPTAEWYIGGFFGALVTGGLAWILVLGSNFDRK